MRPKEKAIELCDKLDDITNSTLCAAKRCALIAVDEITKLFYKDGGIDCFEYIYWNEVKQEIEKL